MTHPGPAADFTVPDAPLHPRRPGRNIAGVPCPNGCTQPGTSMPATVQHADGPGSELWCPACHESYGRE